MKNKKSNYITIKWKVCDDFEKHRSNMFSKKLNHCIRMRVMRKITMREYLDQFHKYVTRNFGIRCVRYKYGDNEFYKIVNKQKFAAFVLNFSDLVEVKHTIRINE